MTGLASIERVINEKREESENKNSVLSSDSKTKNMLSRRSNTEKHFKNTQLLSKS